MAVEITAFFIGENMTVPVSDRLSQLYVGNGANTRFDFTFRVFQQEDETGIAVRQKGITDFETIDPSTYTVTVNQDGMGGFITFSSAPLAGKYFYIAGLTVLDQLLDITNYDNFYPEAIERALDKLTALLQERSTEIDLEKQARILADIQYDSLAMEREGLLENRLINYVNALVGVTNPHIFDGISARMVITNDGRTQQEVNTSLIDNSEDYASFKQETYVREEQIIDHFKQNLDDLENTILPAISNETVRAITAEQELQNQINANGIGNKAYKTYALMDADKTNIPPNSKVTVTNDTDTSKNRDWQWDGTIFTLSDYDPINKSKTYTDDEIKKLPVSNESGIGGAALTLKDVNNWVFGSIGEDGSIDTPLFSLTSANPNEGFIVVDEFGWILLEQISPEISGVPSWAEKKYMLFGDSITQTGDPDNDNFGSGFRANWWDVSNSELRAKSFMNFARSGASYREYPTQLTWQKISHQVTYSLSTGYVPDVIIMSCATNDALAKLGTYEDAMTKSFSELDMTYTADAMRWAYHTLSQNYPKAKLFTCLPIQLAAIEPHTRQPLNDLLIKMANRYGFQIINVGGECGIVRDFEVAGSAGRDLYDGVHPNASGILKIASVITPMVRSRLTNI